MKSGNQKVNSQALYQKSYPKASVISESSKLATNVFTVLKYLTIARMVNWRIRRLGVNHLEISYLVKQFGPQDVLYTNRSSYETPSDEDLASGTKFALQGLVNALENEDSDITKMFCPQNPMLKVYLTN